MWLRPMRGGAERRGEMLSDIEIARAARLKPIADVAAAIGVPDSALHPFGRSIAKVGQPRDAGTKCV